MEEKIMKLIHKDTLRAAGLRLLNPSYSCCSRCGMPWNHCKSKAVYYSESTATFATCDACWDNSTLEELKQYYTETYRFQEDALRRDNLGHKLNHTLKHLLKCVEEEYLKTRTK